MPLHFFLQRFAGIHFDQGEGCELLRLESDGPPKTSSPHILAIEPNRSGIKQNIQDFLPRNENIVYKSVRMGYVNVNCIDCLIRGQYHFEVWVEGKKILGNLNLASAISAFLHLCFSFDLKYPKV